MLPQGHLWPTPQRHQVGGDEVALGSATRCPEEPWAFAPPPQLPCSGLHTQGHPHGHPDVLGAQDLDP